MEQLGSIFVIEQYIAGLKSILEQMPMSEIHQMIALLHQARISGNQVFIMGNGGSASTASHFVCDLGKNTRRNDLPGFRVIGLTDNMALFSALANDEGYENVFSQQLTNLLQTGDVVIAISGSGNSKNVIRAVEMANECGAITVGMTGMGGGRLGQIVQLEIRIPSYQIQQVEDLHLMIEHMIVSALRDIEAEQTETLIPVDFQASVLRPKAEVLFEEAREVEAVDNKVSGVQESYNPPAPTSQANTPQKMRRVLEEALSSTGAISGTLIMLEDSGQPAYGMMMRNGKIEEARIDQLSEVIHHGLAGWVVRHRKAALVGSTSHDPRWLRRNWEERSDTSRSALSVPLTDANQVIGTLTLVHHQPHRFTKQDLARLSRLTSAITPSTPNTGPANK